MTVIGCPSLREYNHDGKNSHGGTVTADNSYALPLSVLRQQEK